MFHTPPEETNTTKEESAYNERDWETLVNYIWFWGYLNRGDCERKLYSEGRIGDFIVRLNSNQQLVISLWYGVHDVRATSIAVFAFLQTISAFESGNIFRYIPHCKNGFRK